MASTLSVIETFSEPAAATETPRRVLSAKPGADDSTV
jgi:hypothetical protein